MATKKEFPQHTNTTDHNYFLCNGVQHREVHYAGCEKCTSTLETEPYFKFRCKERKKYPITKNINPNSSRNTAGQSLTGHLKHLQDAKSTECQVQNLRDCGSTKPDAREMEEILRNIENYASSLKSKIKAIKENESSSKAESTREEPVLSGGLASSHPGDNNASTPIHSVSTSDSSDDEITSLSSSSLESEENEVLVQETERSTPNASPVREKYRINCDLDAMPPNDPNDTTPFALCISESSSDEESE